MLEFSFWIGVTGAGIALAAPILYPALGGLISERSGVLNIGLEGLMLFGAFCGAAVGATSGSPWIGFLAAIGVGAVLGLGFAYLTVSRAANQVVVGLGLNIVALGATGYLLNRFPKTGSPTDVPGFGRLFGRFADAVELGSIVNQTAPVFLGFALVPVVWWALYRTNWGLALRACGDHPQSVDALGLNVVRIRYEAVVVGGMLAAAGGAGAVHVQYSHLRGRHHVRARFPGARSLYLRQVETVGDAYRVPALRGGRCPSTPYAGTRILGALRADGCRALHTGAAGAGRAGRAIAGPEGRGRRLRAGPLQAEQTCAGRRRGAEQNLTAPPTRGLRFLASARRPSVRRLAIYLEFDRVRDEHVATLAQSLPACVEEDLLEDDQRRADLHAESGCLVFVCSCR